MILKGYEGLVKNSREELNQILDDMSLQVNVCYKMIDNKEVKAHGSYFLSKIEEWARLRQLALVHPLNDVGHKLSREIILIKEAVEYDRI